MSSLQDEKAVIVSSAICKMLQLTARNNVIPIQECEAFRCEELLDERKTRGIAVTGHIPSRPRMTVTPCHLFCVTHWGWVRMPACTQMMYGTS